MTAPSWTSRHVMTSMRMLCICVSSISCEHIDEKLNRHSRSHVVKRSQPASGRTQVLEMR